MPREKRVLKYGDPDYAKHDPYGNYRSGVITGARPTDEIRTHDGQLHIHAQGQWHNVHPPGGGSLPHGAYGIRWTLPPDEVRRAGLDTIAMRESRRTVMAPRRPRVMSRRQPSLPSFPDIPEEIEIRIPTMPWTQIGGDMDPGSYGGTIATADGDHIELLKIMPVREYVGDKEAADVGFPFWTKEAYFDLADLDLKNDDVKSALDYIGMSLEDLGEDPGGQKAAGERGYTPEERALVIAEALLDYGGGDEGPSGWSEDLPGHEVKWWGDKVATLPEYVADVDEEFKDDVLGYSDIRSKLEETVQAMADQNSAQAWSTVHDQDALDAERDGYDPDSLVGVAEFGDAVGVNGDIESEKTLKGVEDDLEKEGYEMTEGGGQVPAEEAMVSPDHAIRAVAREMDIEEKTVEDAANGIDWWPKRPNDEIASSTSGWASIWGKKTTGETEEARRRPRVSARRRTR